MVVLEQNPFDVLPEKVNTVPIAATIVGGEIVYRKSAPRKDPKESADAE
jgi:predicted amidohydrolase YtcJ